MSRDETRVLYDDELCEWDSLLNSSLQSTIFHKSIWLTTCEKLSNRKLLILGKFKDDNLIGGCPLFIKYFPAFGVAYSPEKLTPYGGFILQSSESTKVRERERMSSSIFLSISHEIFKLKLDYINIINSPALQDIRPFIGDGWHPNIYYAYKLDLKSDLEKHISKNVRWTIRKAQNLGIKVKKHYDKNIYWDLSLDTYRKQGRSPPFSREYLFGLLEMIMQNNLGEMWIAETDTGEVASAEFVVWDEYMTYRWMAASKSEFLNTGAVSLLLFDILIDLKERDFRMINLLGGNVSKISKFVSSFNPDLVSYFGIVDQSIKYKIARQFLNMRKGLK